MRALRRKKLVLTSIYLAILATVGNMGVDFFRIKYYWPRVSYYSPSTYVLQRSRETPEVLAVGSSRLFDGLNATLLTDLLRGHGLGEVSAFNVAQPGSDLLQGNAQLRDLVASNGCFEIIVFEVAPDGLNRNGPLSRNSGEFGSFRDIRLLGNRLRERKVRDEYLTSAIRGAVRWIDLGFEPPDPALLTLEANRRGSRYSAGAPDRPPRPRGPGPRRLRTSRNKSRDIYWKDFVIGGVGFRALREVMNTAKRCGSRLVLVRLPILFLDRPEDLRTVDRPFRDLMEELTREEGVLFVDLADIPTLDSRYFRDPGHLDFYGSEIVTTYLARDVLPPLLSD